MKGIKTFYMNGKKINGIFRERKDSYKDYKGLKITVSFP